MRASRQPDLVIHAGDDNYRGTLKKRPPARRPMTVACPIPGTNWVTNTGGDIWKTWREDLFDPAAPLFEAAPWVVARGNHELCSRGGRGWFYFLDPHSTLLDPYNALPVCNAPVVRTVPYTLDFDDHRLVVLDSANACDEASYESESAITYQARIYAAQLDRVDVLASTQDALVPHRA